MLPLASILRARGHTVDGSDRSLDQGRTAQKFDFLRNQGINLFPQDGSGVTRAEQILVASAAVEDTVPDMVAAKKVGATRITRAELLSDLFNAAPKSIGVAGTSGKSTTTGMIGWILQDNERAPTIMNGAVMKNFVTPERPFASAATGDSDLFVSEVDESDGSIANYTPHIAVLNNVAFDHKSLDELRGLFSDFVDKAHKAILNLDNEETAHLAEALPADRRVTYSLIDRSADLYGDHIEPAPDGIAFDIVSAADQTSVHVKLHMPGRHNVSNALAAVAAARAVGVSLQDAARSLSTFKGIRRRLEIVGQSNNITVIDDFAHNPDKLTASLETLHGFNGRLIVMFQPHGFGPLRLMKNEFIETFVRNLSPEDILLMPEPVYFGGTVKRTVSSQDIVDGINAQGRQAFALPDRDACGEKILSLAKAGDRIVIAGARDDTLSQFAADLLAKL